MEFRRRSFIKELPMKDVKDRDAQFRNIADIREAAAAIGLPVISIDTKKKELIGNFKREGKALATGQPTDRQEAQFHYLHILCIWEQTNAEMH